MTAAELILVHEAMAYLVSGRTQQAREKLRELLINAPPPPDLLVGLKPTPASPTERPVA